MKEIFVIIVEVVEEPSVLGFIVMGLILLVIFKCAEGPPVPPPVNNSGFDFAKEAVRTNETGSNTGTTSRNNQKTQSFARTGSTEQTTDRPHNLYFCTNHEIYFSYNEQTKHYECKNAIKKINVKYCWECQQHYGAADRLNHFSHEDHVFDSQKPYFRRFYCNSCDFYHYDNVRLGQAK